MSIPYVFPQHFHIAEVAAWNLTLERQIAASWVVRAAYVGNKGTHLFGTADQESGTLNLNPAIYAPGTSTVANTQERRIYPDFGPIGLMDSGFNSNYNALQMNVERRLGHGLSLLSSYTWSKQLNNFSPVGAYLVTNPFNRRVDYGRSDDDISNVFKVSGVYQLPGTHLPGITGKLANGWEVTSILLWQGGFPFSIFSGLDNSLSGEGSDRADFIGTDVHAAQLSSGRSHNDLTNQFFNTSLFVPNAIGTFGNGGKNILRGPKLFNTDLGLLKDTKITEKTALQFRAEFFNAFNNVNFLPPDHIVTDTAFGQITAAGSPRILQFALKFLF